MSLPRAIADMKRFSQGEFAVNISFTNPAGDLTVIVRGLVSKHNLAIDTETGRPVNSRNIHLSVSESVLQDANYETRVNGEISLKRHLVEWADASGIDYKYLVSETIPNETTGLIVCILSDYNG